jgi:AAHS family 4-hydroxybenzoate transporter-like MFS transporter
VNVLKRIDPAFEPSENALTAGTALKHGKNISPLQLFQDGRSIGTLLIWLAKFVVYMVGGIWHSWLTTILVDKGIALNDAIFAGQVASGAGIIAAFVIGPLMDRFGPYKVTAALFLAGGAAIGLLGFSISLLAGGLIVTMAFVTGFSSSSLQKSTTVLCVDFYPITLRSAGLGCSLAIGRVGNIAGPIVVGFLLGWGFRASDVFFGLVIPMLIGALGLYIMGRLYEKGSGGHSRQGAAKPELAPVKP